MPNDAHRVFFVFPGQGSQYRGMGADLVAEFDSAREVFEEASAAVGYDMERLCFEDGDDKLDLTRYTQPALVTHQLACLAALRSLLGESGLEPVLAAGHSLGEYSALVASGALRAPDAIKLVKRRGELMSEFGEGSMLATTLDLETATALADKHFCAVGGRNLPEQTVVAGRDEDLDALEEELAERFPRKRAVRLRTEGAFHTYLMVEAARRFRSVLDEVEIQEPTLGVLSNYTGQVHDVDAQAVRSRLFFQLFHPVRWMDCLETAFGQGVTHIVELGGGIGDTDNPAEKRPNLEGIIKKALRLRGHDAEYLPAINAAALRHAAERLLAP